MWVTWLSVVDWICSKTQILLVTLRNQNQPRGESSEVEHSSPSVIMCKEQTSVSHSSTKLEIMSLDAGLRMDGLLVLDLWNVVIEVLRSSDISKTPTNPAAGNCSRNHKSKPKHMGNRGVDQLSHVDYLTTNSSEIHPRRINAKEVLTPQRSEYFVFPNSRWYSKMVRKRPRFPRTHSKAGTNRKERRLQ